MILFVCKLSIRIFTNVSCGQYWDRKIMYILNFAYLNEHAPYKRGVPWAKMVLAKYIFKFMCHSGQYWDRQI